MSNNFHRNGTFNIVIFAIFFSIFDYVSLELQRNRDVGGSPADTNNYDRFDAPIALNTREV